MAMHCSACRNPPVSSLSKTFISACAYGLPEIYEESPENRAAVYRIAPGETLIFGLDGSYVMLSIYDGNFADK